MNVIWTLQCLALSFVFKSSWTQTAPSSFSGLTNVFTTHSNSQLMRSKTCWLETDKQSREELYRLLGKNKKLIEMRIHFEGHPTDMFSHILKDVYNPFHWIRSTSGQGKRLLMLDDNYKYKSLSTLSIGVVNLQLNVSDHPTRCLRGRHQQEVLAIIRESILRNFHNPEDVQQSPPSLEHDICNTQILRNGDYADFRYRCCHVGFDEILSCDDVTEDSWVKLLFALIIIIKLLVVLFSPLFLPDNLYREKYVAGQYIYHVPGPPLALKVAVTQHPEQFGSKNRHKTLRLSNLRGMKYFKAMVSNSPWNPDKIYQVEIQEVRLSVKARRLLGYLCVPVTFTRLIYNNLIRCRLRRLEACRDCCEADIMGRFTPGLSTITWHTLLKICAQLLMLALLSTPWIIRSILYFTYEAETLDEKTRAARDMGLLMKSNASLVLHLSPVHGLFLVIYIIFIIDSVVYGIVNPAVKEKLKSVVRHCLRDTRERSRTALLAWITRLIVMPFKVCGILGIILFLPYLAIVIIITFPFIVFYLFPTLNFSLRLLTHLGMFLCPQRMIQKFEVCSQKLFSLRKHLGLPQVTANEQFINKKRFSNRGVLLQLVIITMCLISFWSATLLLMEVISFFIEMSVYTFMGVVVNAEVTLQYITVILLVCMYSKNTFSRVTRLYQSYHKVIHKQLMTMAREEMTHVATQEALEQENTAFIVQGEESEQLPTRASPQLIVKNHQPQWRTSGLLVFLDYCDTPLTPEKFFYDTIELNYFGCPGPIYKNVCSAIWEFLKILFFLLFVFVVVMALGDAYQISATNQLIATVVGGFLPFIFKHVFTSNTAVDYIDTSSIQFKVELNKAINNFRQSWPVFDIIPVSIYEANVQEQKPGETSTRRAGLHKQTSTPSTSSSEVEDGSMPARTASCSHNEDLNSSATIVCIDGLARTTTYSPAVTTLVSGAATGVNNDNYSGAAAGVNIGAGGTTTGTNTDVGDCDESTVLLPMEVSDIDIIVDVSNSSTQAAVFTNRDLERGSVSMLDASHRFASQRRPKI